MSYATLSSAPVQPQGARLPGGGFVVKPREILERLLRLVDVGRDGKITADDLRRARVKSLTLRLGPGVEVVLSGAERLSGFAALLGQEIRKGNAEHAILPVSAIAPTRLDAMLAYVAHSWEGLTRRADNVDSLTRAIDEGILGRPADGRYYLYVPQTDEEAQRKLKVQARNRKDIVIVPIPRRRGARWHRRLGIDAGIAYLPRPYLVPGGMFNEMYGWDNYFQSMAALAEGQFAIARDCAENLAYQIRCYGKIGNTNRSYHMSRSQPPLLSSLARAVFSEMERHGDPDAIPFLRRTVRAVELALEGVWGAAPRLTETGLSRYHDEAEGPCPEVPADFYADHPQTPEYWRHDRALRESGWDLSHRFGEEAHCHVPVCLNALLYRYERDAAAMWRRLEGGDSTRAARWDRKALNRRKLVDRYLWDEKHGMYFDWSLKHRARSSYETLATYYPLWVGMASGKQAARVAEMTERFLAPGGLVTSTEASRRRAPRERFQWDWPLGWAPLQIIAVEGLRRYRFHHLADQIAYRWLWMVMRIAGEGNGIIKEKYNVVARSAEVSAAEYLNQGTDRGAYLSMEAQRALGFGWTNASIPLLVMGLEPELQAKLDAGIRPRLAGV
jgi:alpha,alpha-trehalase